MCYHSMTCLRSLSSKLVNIKSIGSDHHNVFTYSKERIESSAFDVKRWTCDIGIETYAFGHWKTRQPYCKCFMKRYILELKFASVIFLHSPWPSGFTVTFSCRSRQVWRKSERGSLAEK